MSETMRAFVLMGHGDMDKMEYHTDWPKPTPGDRQVLIKVGACGLNNTDVNTRTGWYSKGVTEATTGGAYKGAADEDATWGGASISFPRIQGIDAVGTVVEAGPGADEALVGRRVLVEPNIRDWDDPTNYHKVGFFGSEYDGAFAEYTVVDYRDVQPVDTDLSDAELATFPTACLTAENMLNRASVTVGDVVLITGASGGVGSVLVQLVKRRGASPIAIASSSKLEAMRDLGADAVLPREAEDLAAALREATGRDTVSVVADVVGGPAFPAILDLIERGGRYVCAGAIAGPIVEFDLRTCYLRDLSVFGATVVPPGTFADVVGYIERGEIKPVLARTYPFSELKEAQKDFIAKRHVGNLVVVP